LNQALGTDKTDFILVPYTNLLLTWGRYFQLEYSCIFIFIIRLQFSWGFPNGAKGIAWNAKLIMLATTLQRNHVQVIKLINDIDTAQ